MRSILRGVYCRGALVALLGSGLGSAQSVVYFNALDAGVGPLDARPNSDGEASLFDAEAAMLGDMVLNVLDFESVTLGDFLNLSPAETGVAGVSILAAGGSSGVDTSITNQTIPLSEGFNTSAGGSQFLKIEENQPGPGVEPPVGIVFDFAKPIVAFGAYFTGADPIVPGAMTVSFNNGQLQTVPLFGSVGGGVEFWGFTDADPGAPITQVTIMVSPEAGENTDVMSLDDVRWVHVPEPDVPLLVMLASLFLLRRRR